MILENKDLKKKISTEGFFTYKNAFDKKFISDVINDIDNAKGTIKYFDNNKNLRRIEKLYDKGEQFAEAWNFGPKDEDSKSVKWIVEKLCDLNSGSNWITEDIDQLHEAAELKLDSSKAKANLDWSPRWNLDTALNKTVEWHKAWKNNEDMEKLTNMQINQYTNTKKITD